MKEIIHNILYTGSEKANKVMTIIYIAFIVLFYIAPIVRWFYLNDGINTQKQIEDLFFAPLVSLYNSLTEMILFVLATIWMLLQLLAFFLLFAFPYIVLKEYFAKRKH